MLTRKERDLLLKLLIEKENENNQVNLQLVDEFNQSNKFNKPKKIFRRYKYQPKPWSVEDSNFVRLQITLGKTDQQIAALLGNRTAHSIYMFRWRLKENAS